MLTGGKAGDYFKGLPIGIRIPMNKKILKPIVCTLFVLMTIGCLSLTVFAAGDVSGAIESTWNSAKGQIQSVVNNVVFPVVDMILAVLFFVKVGTAYFDYRKHGQFEFAAPAILFALGPTVAPRHGPLSR